LTDYFINIKLNLVLHSFWLYKKTKEEIRMAAKKPAAKKPAAKKPAAKPAAKKPAAKKK
jgi:hypothetical protein